MPKPRKSNAELRRTGSHEHPDDPIAVPLGQPDAPDDLTPCETRTWDETVQLLDDAGRLTRLDGAAVRAYCRSVCEWQSAYADLQKHGPYQQAGTGAQKLSVQLQRFNLCDRALQRWCSELGLSPKSRPMGTAPKNTGPSLDDILNSGNQVHYVDVPDEEQK